MITSICMNPSFDKTVEVPALEVGEVNRIRTSRTDMGGKGINVAVVAQRLGLNCQCLGVMGEDGADRLQAMLNKEGMKNAFLTVPGSVRTNTKIVSLDGKGVTELNEPGAPMNEEQLKAFFDLAREKTAGSRYAVLTGSLPPGCPVGTYRDLMRALEGVNCILDVGGKELELGAEAHPFLIKPNLSELEATLGLELRTLRSIRDAALIFLRKGVQHVIVSMGSMGAMYVSKEKTLFAPALRVEAKSTVGAGDAMVGGLLKGLEVEGDMAHAFRYGVAAGAASVMTEGTQLIVPEDFDNLLGQVKVQEV
ncbi:MAG: 1-phosphofructokinase [Clostridia bacterium]|nr:1-phosphofructokinase [Clostridia bacterium]